VAAGENSLFDTRMKLSEAWRSRLAPLLAVRNFLWLFALLFFLIAWNRGISLIYAMSALMLAILLVSYLMPYWSMRGMKVRRNPYLTTAVGESLVVEFELQRQGFGWCRMLEVIDRVPCAEQPHQQPMAYIPKLSNRYSTAYEVDINWRGLHRLGPVSIASSYPIGVHRVSREVPDSTAQVLVHPSPFPIRSLVFSHAASERTGRHLSTRPGRYDEFSGIREYRHGDSPRHIHWAKSGQSGGLLVKEYEAYEDSGVSIVLDRRSSTNLGSGRHSTFEYQVTIALSIARYCIDNAIPVALFGVDRQSASLQCSETHYRRVLESLAVVEADWHKGEPDYQHYVRSLVEQHPRGHWVLFSNDINEPDPLFRHRARPAIMLVEFDSASFTTTGGRAVNNETAPSPFSDHYVRCGDNLSEVFAR
jgi:uncharacterized protein (DUF58 family)